VYCKFRARTRVSSADCFSSDFWNTKRTFVFPSPSYPVGRVIWVAVLGFGLVLFFVCCFVLCVVVFWGGGARQDFLLIEDLPARFAVITNRGTRA
jgi:hypothetical protein